MDKIIIQIYNVSRFAPTTTENIERVRLAMGEDLHVLYVNYKVMFGFQTGVLRILI